MFGIGMGELILILIVGLVLFGAEGLQEVAKVAGKLMREFKKMQSSLQSTLDEIDLEDNKSKTTSESKDQPAKNEYQPPTQESVRAELEKIAGKDFQSPTETEINSSEKVSLKKISKT